MHDGLHMSVVILGHLTGVESRVLGNLVLHLVDVAVVVSDSGDEVALWN